MTADALADAKERLKRMIREAGSTGAVGVTLRNNKHALYVGVPFKHNVLDISEVDGYPVVWSVTGPVKAGPAR